MSKRTVELGDFKCRKGRYEMSQLALKHQGEKITTDRGRAWQPILRPEYYFGRESEYLSVNRRTDEGRHVVVLSDKSTRYYDVESRLRTALRDALTGAVDFSSPHGRACSAISARAWRAIRLRCLRNIAPSLAGLACLRTLSAYWRSAVRSSAERLQRRDDVSASLSSSLEVASSIAIVFMDTSISALLDCSQGILAVPSLSANTATM